MSIDAIGEGSAALAHDGDVNIGAARRIQSNGLLVYIENYGEVTLGRKDVVRASEGKVALQPDRLSQEVLEAIAHAHDQEPERT